MPVVQALTHRRNCDYKMTTKELAVAQTLMSAASETRLDALACRRHNPKSAERSLGRQTRVSAPHLSAANPPQVGAIFAQRHHQSGGLNSESEVTVGEHIRTAAKGADPSR